MMNSFKIAFIYLIVSKGSFAQESSDYNKEILNGKFKIVYNLNPKYFCYNDLEIIDPGIVVIPCDSAVYMAGLNLNYFKFNKKNISGVGPSTDSTIFYINNSKENVIVHKLSKSNKSQTDIILFKINKGNFHLKVVNRNLFYLYGVSSSGESKIYRYFEKKLDTLLSSKKIISQLDIMNQSTLIFNLDSAIYIYPIAEKPKRVFQCPNLIDGLTIRKDGSVYFSTVLGVFQLDNKFAISQLTTDKIHGKLRYYKRSLFVLNLFDPCIIEIEPK